MSAEFESGFFVAEPAWHGLGVVLPDAPKTSREAIVASGLDWRVEKTPLLTVAPNGKWFEVPDQFSVTRKNPAYLGIDKDYTSLGVVGKKYTPLQNIDAFNFFDDVIKDGNAFYHTAGSLQGGKTVWMLAKIGDPMRVVGDDFVEKFILLYNSHDGSHAVTMQLTPIRVVCANTLAMAKGMTNESSKKMSVRHTRLVLTRMKDIAKYLGYLNETFEETQVAFQHMAQKKMTDRKALKDYIKSVFSPGVEEEDMSTRSKNIISAVEELVETGIGVDIAGDGMNYWKAYNAVTEFVDYHRGGDDRDRNLRSAWMGQGMKIKKDALANALSA